MHGPEALLSALKVMNITVEGGTIVNLGAALVHPGPHQASANDDAWNLFFSSKHKYELRIVAFEGNEWALNQNDRVLNQSGGRFELRGNMRHRTQLVREFADPFTLVSLLEQHGVPRDFLLLKIDVDSIDLHAFDVITRAFRPALVLVEKASMREDRQPQGIGFAALKLRPAAPDVVGSGGGKGDVEHGAVDGLGYAKDHPAAGTSLGRGAVNPPVARRCDTFSLASLNGSALRYRWRQIGCSQSDTMMWLSHAPRRGYTVIQAEHKKNYLLAQTAYASRFPPLTCEGARGPARRITAADRSLHRTFAQYVEECCAAQRMEYVLEVDGVCCPKEVHGVPVSLEHCRCLS